MGGIDADGTILKPSKPLTAIDSMLTPNNPHPTVLGSYDGPLSLSAVWAWYFVSHQLKEEFTIRVSDLYPAVDDGKKLLVTREWHSACPSGSIVPGPCAQLVSVDPE